MGELRRPRDAAAARGRPNERTSGQRTRINSQSLSFLFPACPITYRNFSKNSAACACYFEVVSRLPLHHGSPQHSFAAQRRCMFDGADLPVRPLKPERVLPLAIGLGGRPWIRIHNVQWYTDSVETHSQEYFSLPPTGIREAGTKRQGCFPA